MRISPKPTTPPSIPPSVDRVLVEESTILGKFFFDVSREAREKRFRARIEDPKRQRKLSPMDVEPCRRWWDYTAA